MTGLATATASLEDIPANPDSQPPPLRKPAMIAYGIGAAANGIKDNGFGFFLLLFYSQVIGLEAHLVGLALVIVLAVDAIANPLVGAWSDNFRSRWGRRHPFMYAAALPVALGYFMLWNPPVGWGQAGLFWYLLGTAIVIRFSILCFQAPSSALVAELSENYDERSVIMSWRLFFAWTAGNIMSVLMFAFLFPAFTTELIPDGKFNREAYELYGIVASCAMFLIILVSAFGTHHRIRYFRQPPPREKLSVLQMLGSIIEPLKNRSFLALFVSKAFAAVAAGLSASLSFYFTIYFWGFSSSQIAIQMMLIFASAIIGKLIGPVISRRYGKKKGAIGLGLIAFIGAPMPIVLRLFGILPPGNSDEIFWFVALVAMFDVGLIIAFQTLTYSMAADLVEQAELKTGRRQEGVIFAAIGFIEKMVAGLGLGLGTVVLTAAGLKAGADVSEVSAETLWRLGAIYVPTILGLWMSMIAVMALYKIDRQTHEANLRALAGSAKEA